MSNTDPSNARAPESIDLGMIAGIQGGVLPMYHEPEVTAQIKNALMECHWLTHKSSAYAYGVYIRFRGADMVAIVDNPINPDIPDPTDPANAPADDDNNPDPRFDPRDGQAKP